ncbi:MAG TPA: hypothetical protein VGB17_11265 [Pyrinomonadaceae bacterium]|jgi:hypothetical protein
MINRCTLTTVIAAALIAFCLPVLAAAQGTWGQPDYQRDRDYRRNRDNGGYGNYGRYDRQTIRNSVNRLKDLSGRLRNDIDRALDHSRVDGTRREDRINDMARDFQRAASDLKDRFNDGRDLNRSQTEARRVLDLASRMDSVINRGRVYDNRVASDWAQIRQELNVIGSVYGYNGNYGNGGYYGRDRDDRYGRDRNRDDRNRNNNDGWWRRLPFPQ